MSTKQFSQPNQRAFHYVLESIKKIAKELSIKLIITGHRIHSDQNGISKLQPSISVEYGDVSLKIWNKSIVRSRSWISSEVDLAQKEAMYAQAHELIIEWLIRVDLSQLLKNKLKEADNLNRNINPLTPSFKHTTKERIEQINSCVGDLVKRL
jgi:hypothetical protein